MSNALSNVILENSANISKCQAIDTKGGVKYVAGVVIAPGSKLQGRHSQESREGRANIHNLGLTCTGGLRMGLPMRILDIFNAGSNCLALDCVSTRMFVVR